MTCPACSASLKKVIALTFEFVSLAYPLGQRRSHKTAAWSMRKLSGRPRQIIPVDLPQSSAQKHHRNGETHKEVNNLAAISDKGVENESSMRPERQYERQPWQTQKEALKRKFKDGPWSPLKRLSPDALDGIRAMHSQFPEKFTTPVLAEHFKVSPEVIRRILKSKWAPSEEETEDRKLRWERRGQKIWAERAEKGVKPPTKWRRMGIGKPSYDQTPRENVRRKGQGDGSGIKVYGGITATRVTDYGDQHSRRNSGNSGSSLVRRSLGERIL